MRFSRFETERTYVPENFGQTNVNRNLRMNDFCLPTNSKNLRFNQQSSKDTSQNPLFLQSSTTAATDAGDERLDDSRQQHLSILATEEDWSYTSEIENSSRSMDKSNN